MYAIIVGTPSCFVFDSIWEEKHFVDQSDTWGGFVPAFMNRVNEMARAWVKDGQYVHPQESNPETKSLLGYAPGFGRAVDALANIKDSFFVFVARENRHGEIHFWNARYSAIYEFNWSGAPEQLNLLEPVHAYGPAWYVRALNFPASLETYVWDQASFERGDKPPHYLPSRSPKAKERNLIPISLTTDQSKLKCVKKELMWSKAHLEALRSKDLGGLIVSRKKTS